MSTDRLKPRNFNSQYETKHTGISHSIVSEMQLVKSSWGQLNFEMHSK